MPSVLFVCLGNICRSPAGEGILKSLLQRDGLKWQVDSCGLGSWHAGEKADKRMRQSAQERGIKLDSLSRAIIAPKDFESFDYILAADQSVNKSLQGMAKDRPLWREKIVMMTEFSSDEKERGRDVPDPYYGGSEGFELVMDLLERSCEGLIRHLSK